MLSGQFSDVRQLHVRGFVSIAKDSTASNKNKFVTTGTDGTVSIWEEGTFTEKKVAETKTLGEATHGCIAWMGNNIYAGYTVLDINTGIEKRVIGKISVDDWDSPTTLINFPLEPLCLDVSKTHLVAGGSDFTIRICNLDDSNDTKKIEVDGEVISVKIDPKNEVVAAACINGEVRIYSLSDGSELALFPKMFNSFGCVEIEHSRVQLNWKDSELMVPSQNSIRIITKDNDGWKSGNPFLLKGPQNETFSCTSVSDCGTWLAASSISNMLCVWNISTRNQAAFHTYNRIAQGNNTITDICFSPFDPKSIIVTDANEGMSLWSRCIPSEIKTIDDEDVEIKHKKKKRIIEEDDDEEEEGNSLEDILFLNEAREDNAEDIDENTNMSADIGAIKRKYGMGRASSTLDDYGFGPDARNSHDATESSTTHPTSVTQIVAYDPDPIPSRFVSGASADHIHVDSRYLKWNAHGYVLWKRESEENSSIQISFFDASISSDIMLDNKENFSLADLSDKAVVLASKASDAKDTSTVLVISMESMDSEQKRWSTTLPKKDGAVDVLVSKAQIVILTEQRNIRIFSLAGTQRLVLTHPGPYLTAATFGTKVAIASVSCSEFFEEIDGEKMKKPQYQYAVTIYETSPNRWYQNIESTKTIQIPVAPRKTITWLEYSDMGDLVMMDNSYVARLLTPSGFWIPIFDGSTKLVSKLDSIWPIMVAGGDRGLIRYFYSKASKHPPTSDCGVASTENWKLPMCQPESEKTQLEETLLLNELQQSFASLHPETFSQTTLLTTNIQTIVKLFALACRSGRESRALELAHVMTSTKGIQVLAQYAAGSKRMVLADKLSAIGREQIDSDIVVNKPQQIIRPRAPRVPISTPKIDRHALEEDMDPEPEEIVEDNESQLLAELDESMQSTNPSIRNVLPLKTANRNPFKRAVESPALNSSSCSVFDQMEESIINPRKRGREEHSQTTQSKQVKLSFTPKTKGPGNENKITAYSLWLSETESSLRKIFSGDVTDFEKFCASQFRLLTPTEKKEWRTKAETSD